MRLFLRLVMCCLLWGMSFSAQAQESVFPTEASFITELADEAIDDERGAAASDRVFARELFANAFLGGYTNPDSTVPVNQNLYHSRINGRGWEAGQGYRQRHPDSVAQVMREYGYRGFEGAGVWSVGFEAGGFRPDEVEGESSFAGNESCWYLGFIRHDDLNDQVQSVVSDEGRVLGATVRVKVTGYVSPPGSYGHLGACRRRLLVTGISGG